MPGTQANLDVLRERVTEIMGYKNSFRETEISTMLAKLGLDDSSDKGS